MTTPYKKPPESRIELRAYVWHSNKDAYNSGYGYGANGKSLLHGRYRTRIIGLWRDEDGEFYDYHPPEHEAEFKRGWEDGHEDKLIDDATHRTWEEVRFGWSPETASYNP